MSAAARDRAADAWAFRWAVEIHAEHGFRRLAHELDALSYPSALVASCSAVADDEARHVLLCERVARHLGAQCATPLDVPISIAPRSFDRAQAAVYELVARSCVAETETHGSAPARTAKRRSRRRLHPHLAGR